jgi:hypothetical protein
MTHWRYGYQHRPNNQQRQVYRETATVRTNYHDATLTEHTRLEQLANIGFVVDLWQHQQREKREK